jgi:hypothetical protein
VRVKRYEKSKNGEVRKEGAKGKKRDLRGRE